MSIVEMVAEKLQGLPENSQKEVLALVDRLVEKRRQQLKTSYSSCADIASNLDFEEFAKARQQMWRDVSGEELE